MGFIEDIELLKGKRIIRKDKDISDRTGYKKSTVSNYLSGKVPPSKPFLDKFYEVYSSDLGMNKVSTVNTSELENKNQELQKENSELMQKVISLHERLDKKREQFEKQIERRIDKVLAAVLSEKKN